MGLDIVGISNLNIKPVPEGMRAKVTPGKTIKMTEIATKVAMAAGVGAGAEEMQKVLAMMLVTQGLEGAYNEAIKNGKDEIVKPAEIEISPDGEKWEETERDNNQLEHVDWERSMAYYRDNDTKNTGAGRSYGGIGTFCAEFGRLNPDGETLFLPCDGVAYAEECDKNYRMMQTVWPLWSKKYHNCDTATKEERELSDHLDDIMMHDVDFGSFSMDWEKDFFLYTAKCFYYGKTCGLVIYC